jgi:heat shock protein 1/8
MIIVPRNHVVPFDLVVSINHFFICFVQGNRTTPSYVAFTDTERLIGDAAKNQVAMNPTNTIFDAKRLIGRKFTDATVQADMKHWPFKV